MGTYVDILHLLLALPALPDVLVVLGVEPLTVLGWGLQILLYVVGGLLNGILGWLAVERLAKPLISRWRRGGTSCVDGESREREAVLHREIGRLEGRLEAKEDALQQERAVREESDRQIREADRRIEQIEAELEEKRRPWWRRLSGR